MTDPAIEAAQHALGQRPWFGYGQEEQLALIAAREALEPLRAIHVEHEHLAMCIECEASWPCRTAKLIYTTEELES